jgi:STE24 endopeptidase
MYPYLFIIFVVLMAFGFAFEKALEVLNASRFGIPIPAVFKKYFPQDFQTQSVAYQKSKYHYSLIQGSISFLATFLFWILGGFGWLSAEISQLFTNEIIRTLVFFGALGAASGLVSLPFTYYFHFVIEEKYGFNKMTLKTFIGDQIKSGLLAILLGGGLIALVVWVYQAAPEKFWWLVWLLMSVIMIFLTAFYAQLIVPLFNKQTKLEDGELRTAIQGFAKKAGFSLAHIFVMDGSKRSSKANAYFTGLGSKKRIVLYDTLIHDLETKEIVAVLAHEVGHYEHRHTLYNIVLGILQTGFMLFVLSLFIAPDSQIGLAVNRVVAQDPRLMQTHFYLGLIGFGIVYSPVSTILGILMNMLSRSFEYQADAFAAKHTRTEDLKTALVKLSKNSRSQLSPHPFYVFVYYSHPTLLQRFKELS